MNEKFLKPYNPTEAEARVAKAWDDSGFFNPDNLPERNKAGEPFSIVLPPPNVTGQLHLGHATAVTVGDIMVRHARMQGRRTLWIPGTDHAAIATQSKVEKEIQKKEGKSRHDLGREELLRRVTVFAEESHSTIVNQIRKMGASIDWSREAFTLDERRNYAVRTAFKKMYDDGLIYRGFRVVNWDPKGQTTISDDEIVYETRKAKLYTFKYSKDIPISISTTRPETKLGDTAIAVHPDDPRYQALIGREYDATFAGERIHLKVIADRGVDKEFGTGALGVTPAHSNIDWEMAQRHDLPLKQVINEYAKMTVGNDAIIGKKTTEARELVVEWLKSEGLLEKEEEVEQNVSTAERTGGIVEPLPKLQWFIGVNRKFKVQSGTFKGQEKTLKELMLAAVQGGINGHGAIKIIPDRFEKVYTHWIENLRDWCISRQIWYGHRIPVWYKENAIKDAQADTSLEGAPQATAEDSSGFEASNPRTRREKVSAGVSEASSEIYCGIEAPTGDDWTQDPDTLDTWFSSGLWTFSTLGWPEQTDDLKRYHPTTVLETGRDILFFWIARMILMSTYLLNDIPFKTAYLNGLVLNKEGKKMSKSDGNNLDPLDLIRDYGADAVRMALIVGVGPGNDSKISLEKVKAYKLFANKLWNIARFILSSTEKVSLDQNFAKFTDADKAHLDRLHSLVAGSSVEMNEFKYYLVAEKLYHYAWHELADKILEESKPIVGVFGAPEPTDQAAKLSRQQFLLAALSAILKLLHPFMPFVTEEIWSASPFNKGLLMVEEWPAK